MIYRASRWALEARIGLAPSRSERDPTDDRHRRRAPRASHGSSGPDGATAVHNGNAKVRANADIPTRSGVDPERVLIAQDGTVIDLVDGQATITGTRPRRARLASTAPALVGPPPRRRHTIGGDTVTACPTCCGEPDLSGTPTADGMLQAASDSFLGWIDGPAGRSFYVRQLRDMKWAPDPSSLSSQRLRRYAVLCGHTLAQAHARSGIHRDQRQQERAPQLAEQPPVLQARVIELGLAAVGPTRSACPATPAPARRRLDRLWSTSVYLLRRVPRMTHPRPTRRWCPLPRGAGVASPATANEIPRADETWDKHAMTATPRTARWRRTVDAAMSTRPRAGQPRRSRGRRLGCEPSRTG